MEPQPALATDDGVRAVYAAHGPELYRFAVRSLGDRGLAEEAVQETFVRAWRAADRFDDELGSLRTWLFAIVRNVVIDLSRARAVRPGLSASDAAADDGLVRRRGLRPGAHRVAGRGSAAHAERRAPRGAHRGALQGPRRTREVASSLGVPVGTVKSRVYYALKAMRLALEELGWSRDD